MERGQNRDQDEAAVSNGRPNTPGLALCKCGAVPHPFDAKRCAKGHPLLGHALTVEHALNAVRLPPELEHLHQDLAAFEAGCVVDEGCAEADIPTRRRALLHDRARVERRIRQIDDALEIRGLIDRRGRLRVSWLQRLEGLIATAIRLDTLLGLERRAKRTQSLADVLDQARAELDAEIAAAETNHVAIEQESE